MAAKQESRKNVRVALKRRMADRKIIRRFVKTLRRAEVAETSNA